MRFTCAGFLVVFIFPACQKIIEYYNPGSNNTPLSCRIKNYSYDYYGSLYRTTIEYDNRGNPGLITYYDEWSPDGQVVEQLEYDSLGRLIFHEPYLYMGSSRVYVYEGNSRTPVRDTAQDLWGKKYLETFRYDLKGRIIWEEIKLIYTPPESEEDPFFETEVHRYYYDANGNRQVNPFDYPWHKTIQYTQKPSIYSLHPAWQIIYRDFSKNSVPNVDTYNETGLPLTFQLEEDIYWQPFLDLPYTAKIAYDCNNDVK